MTTVDSCKDDSGAPAPDPSAAGAGCGRPGGSAMRHGLLCALLFLAIFRPSAPAVAEGPRFRDAAEEWGLLFRHHNGSSGKLLLMETFGSGVVIFDYDGDGDPDVFFVDSGPLPGYEGEPTGSVLYRNDGGRFVDVTRSAGLTVPRYGMGATAADYDGDGDLDLYLTAFGPNVLYRNEGDGRFVDVTAVAGVGEERWSASAAFADVDLDGDLDLYVTNYVAFPVGKVPICGPPNSELRSYCHPALFDGLPDRFYRNRGDGTFEDATAAAGFSKADGKGLGVVFGDVDDDDLPDLYVANDTTPNFLFQNLGGGRFEDVSLLSGTAFNAEGKAEAGMGVDFGDVDGDGRDELVVTNFDLETNGLYGNSGDGLFFDRRFVSGIAEPSLYRVGFGVALADLDLDGDLDLAVANGHIMENIDLFPNKKGNTYRQPNQILENVGRGRFQPVADPGLETVESSRGLAVGDLDLDGDLDLVITNSNALAEVYENVSPPRSWLGVALARSSGSGQALDRQALGARITLRTGSVLQARELRSGASYLSQSEGVARFGLGSAESVGPVEIRWGPGERQRLLGVESGRVLRVLRSEAR